jgi:serine/threonine-protein kinase HipA
LERSYDFIAKRAAFLSSNLQRFQESVKQGSPVSLEMPMAQSVYEYDRFPPFFEGVLPEGFMLDSLLKGSKIDRSDFMTQIITVGHDLVGNVTVEAMP